MDDNGNNNIIWFIGCRTIYASINVQSPKSGRVPEKNFSSGGGQSVGRSRPIYRQKTIVAFYDIHARAMRCVGDDDSDDDDTARVFGAVSITPKTPYEYCETTKTTGGGKKITKLISRTSVENQSLALGENRRSERKKSVLSRHDDGR